MQENNNIGTKQLDFPKVQRRNMRYIFIVACFVSIMVFIIIFILDEPIKAISFQSYRITMLMTGLPMIFIDLTTLVYFPGAILELIQWKKARNSIEITTEEKDYTYQIITRTLEYYTYIFTQSDTLDYIKIYDMVKNSVTQEDEYTIKVTTLHQKVADNYTDPGSVVALQVAIGSGLIVIGMGFVAAAIVFALQGATDITFLWITISAATWGNIFFIVGIVVVIIGIILLRYWLHVANNP